MTQKEALKLKKKNGLYCGGCIFFEGLNKSKIKVLQVLGFCKNSKSKYKQIHRDYSCEFHKFPVQEKKGKKR